MEQQYELKFRSLEIIKKTFLEFLPKNVHRIRNLDLDNNSAPMITNFAFFAITSNSH